MLAEPLGILSGADANAAIAAGVARRLGHSLAFTLVRALGESGPPILVADWPGDLSELEAVPGWAGLPPGPAVMAVLNLTPDSFSDGGARDIHGAVALGEQMIAEGAAILDIGGESTRPGAQPVPPAEEQRRILPAIRALAGRGALISVDTRNADTMARALDAGAAIVNDVSALAHDPAAPALVAARRCPVILMHMRGTPETMAGLARYENVAAEVHSELAARVAVAAAAGVDLGSIAVDPGFGFAKAARHSQELLMRLPALLNLGCRIVAGVSRKSLIGALAGEMAADARGPGSLAAGLMALSRGASILRVHDVAATVQAVRVWQGLAG